MGTLSLELPGSIHRELAEAAEREGFSVNQLSSSNAAQKLAALMAEDDLTHWAARASARTFDTVLAKIPDSVPEPGDELPSGQGGEAPRRRRG